jgi:hypothetical protein
MKSDWSVKKPHIKQNPVYQSVEHGFYSEWKPVKYSEVNHVVGVRS